MQKIVSRTLNYNEHVFILASTITGCISAFAFTYWYSNRNYSTKIGLKICAIAAGIK